MVILGHLNQVGIKLHVPLNLSKDGCQLHDCFYLDDVISHDGGKSHDCYLNDLFS